MNAPGQGTVPDRSYRLFINPVAWMERSEDEAESLSLFHNRLIEEKRVGNDTSVA